MKITRLKHGVHVYSNIVPLSESREMLKTTFAFCFFRVSTIYLPLRFWSALLEWKSRRAIKRFKKCFLIMFKYFEHENCATNSLRLDLWSTESLIHPNKEYEAPFMGTKGVSNMKKEPKKCWCGTFGNTFLVQETWVLKSGAEGYRPEIYPTSDFWKVVFSAPVERESSSFL